MTKKNPLRTEAAIRKANKRYRDLYDNVDAYVGWNEEDTVLIFHVGDTTIAELSVNDYLRKAPVKKGMKAVLKTLRKRK